MKHKRSAYSHRITAYNYLIDSEAAKEPDTSNYGRVKEVSFLPYEDEIPFTVEGIMVYTSTGFLTKKDHLYIRTSAGGAPFPKIDESDKKTWGHPIYFQHDLTSAFQPESLRGGGFVYRYIKIHTRRFSVSLVFESNLIDIRSVFVNIVPGKKIRSSDDFNNPKQEVNNE